MFCSPPYKTAWLSQQRRLADSNCWNNLLAAQVLKALDTSGAQNSETPANHYLSWQRRALWRVIISDGCWHWDGCHNTSGYGILSRDGRPFVAHRAVYEILVGPIPAGAELDHLCRDRGCVRPDHLEPISRRENILRGEGACARNARKTHCKRGHEFTPENTIEVKNGRRCRTCLSAWRSADRAKKNAAVQGTAYARTDRQ